MCGEHEGSVIKLGRARTGVGRAIYMCFLRQVSIFLVYNRKVVNLVSFSLSSLQSSALGCSTHWIVANVLAD